MTWECACGVSNRDSKVKCSACGTPKGMVWTPEGFVRAEEAAAIPHDLVTVPFEFTGKVGEYFKIWIVNVSLTILTLGIYSAWAKVRKKRYFYGNTLLQNAPFEYLADPIKILKGRLIVVGVFVVYTLTTNFLPATEPLFGLLFFGIFPWVVVRALTFKTRNSSYRNIRFDFTASYGEAAGVFILKAIFVGVTFGLAYPFFAHSRSKFAMDHSSYGKTRFVFLAPVNSFYFIYFVAGLVGLGGVVALQVFLPLFSFFLPPTPAQQGPGLAPMIIALLAFGLVVLLVISYVKTETINVVWSNTSLGKNRFKSTLRFSQMLWLYLSNAVAILLSLGLLIPWASIRMARYRLDNLQLLPADDLDAFIAAEQEKVGAAGEEILDFFDFDMGI